MNKFLRYSFVALLAMVMGSAWADDVTDVLTWDKLLEAGKANVYQDFAGKTITSTAVYAGNASSGTDAFIQLRTKNNNSGIVTTASGGKLKMVKITFNSKTTDRAVEIYGKNEAYASASDLYGDAKGTLLGSIAANENKILTVEGDYSFVGIKSADGAIYVDNIEITWSTSGGTPVTIQAPQFSVAGGTYYEPQTVAMTCETEGAKILYTIPAGNDPEYIDDDNYTGVFYDGTPLTITKTTTIKAMAVKDGKTSSIVSATYTIAEIEEITVAKALEIINALEDGKTTTEEYQVKGFIVGTPDFQRKADQSLYGNVNFTIADEKGGTTTLTVFRAKDLDNVNFTEETINRIKEGDEVVVQGKLQKYVKNEVVTPELTSGYLISVTAGEDPDPGIDPSATIYEVPVSKFAPWDGTSIEGNVITMGAGWKGGAIYVGGDMTQFDYVWIKFKNATGTPNFGITYDEWTSNADWGPVFAAVTTAMDGTGMVGIKLDKKTVMVHGNAETGGVGIGDVYAQHVQQITIQGGNSAASVEVEGIWFGTTAEFVKAGGDVPVRPEAGGALTMWEGELVYDGWGVSSTIDPKYFEVAEVGDIIYCSVKDVTADYNPIFKYQDWSDFTDIQATLAKDETHFEGKIATAEALDYLQKNGLRFQGVGFTLTKVELKVPDPSGVNTINVVKADNGAIYNVAGQKVNAGYKGLVIKNGKKFVNK
jgi:hypothetical protein